MGRQKFVVILKEGIKRESNIKNSLIDVIAMIRHASEVISLLPSSQIIRLIEEALKFLLM
jgi:hypothetical protein